MILTIIWYGLMAAVGLALLLGNFLMLWDPRVKSDTTLTLALALVLFALALDATLAVLGLILVLGYGVHYVLH